MPAANVRRSGRASPHPPRNPTFRETHPSVRTHPVPNRIATDGVVHSRLGKGISPNTQARIMENLGGSAYYRELMRLIELTCGSRHDRDPFVRNPGRHLGRITLRRQSRSHGGPHRDQQPPPRTCFPKPEAGQSAPGTARPGLAPAPATGRGTQGLEGSQSATRPVVQAGSGVTSPGPHRVPRQHRP